MNIHFDDNKLFNSLQQHTIKSIEVGSVMYGIKSEISDTDYLCIYREDTENLKSFMYEHHQFQYKGTNTDYNFTNVQTFIRNILTGDSTINFEVLFSRSLIGTELEFLFIFRHNFINYNIIKSYLGLAKRDLKMYLSGKDSTPKKLSHFYRSVLFAEQLMGGELDLLKHRDFLYGTKYKHENEKYLLDFKTKMIYLRDLNNKNLENNKIERIMDAKMLHIIDRETKKIPSSAINIDYGMISYLALANGIQY